MQRCRRESTPRASATDFASVGAMRAPLLAGSLHAATPDTQWPAQTCGCETQAVCDENHPRSRSGVCFPTRGCSEATTFVQQDAVPFLAEQKFTETLIQEADLAESTLEQEEALFQKCMDDIARDMRRIMEDERWLFVSEYLSHKAEQRKLNDDLRHNEVPEIQFLSSPQFFRGRQSTSGRSKDATTHVRFLLDESLNPRDSFAFNTSECITQSSCNPSTETSLLYHERVDHCYDNLNKLSYICPPIVSTSPKILEHVNDVNVPLYSYKNDIHRESKRYYTNEHDIDSKKCCCKKYDCCICRKNCNRCSPKPDHEIGDYASPYSLRRHCEDDSWRAFSLNGHSPTGHHHSCANHGDYSCPRHGCRTCSPSARPPRRCCTSGPCHCGQSDPKRTQSEKLTLEDVLGRLAAVGAGCHSEATVTRGSCGCSRRRQAHGGRHGKGQTRSRHCSCQKVRSEALDKATAPCWKSSNLKGALASSSDKNAGMSRHTDTLLTSQDENETSLSHKTKFDDDKETPSREITRVESRRFAPDEERRLLVLIEARDALVQEAVEKGLSDQLASIESLNKQIRAFVFSQPGGEALEVTHDHHPDPKVHESSSANTSTAGNVVIDNSDSV